MLFNSYVFILLFLPVTLCGLFLLGKTENKRLSTDKPGKVWLILASACFYGFLNIYYALFLAGSALINFGLQRVMEMQTGKARRRGILALGVTVNLAALFYLKYWRFSSVLTVGISFITFQQISYLADCYKENGLRHDFLDYAVYISFFPKVTSGPITQFREFLQQLSGKNIFRPKFENLSGGLYLFAMGLAKKVILADTLAKLVNIGFSNIAGLHTGSALLVMLSYSLQLYYDFSGYSDMALGVALMMNIHLPVNFDSPYKARSVSDFWNRWHISLTRFFTKYLYIPLGGSRKGMGRTCVNILIVFILSGIWHGAGLTFLVWGLLHGLAMVAERLTGRRTEKIPVLGRGLTFLFVNVAWVIFRADSLSDAGLFFSRILVPGTGAVETALAEAVNNLVEIRILCRLGLQGLSDSFPFLMLLIVILIMLLIAVIPKNTQERLKSFSYSAGQTAATVALLFWSIISLSGISVFLYSNF